MSAFKPALTNARKMTLAVYDLMWNDQNGLCCYCERLMVHKKHAKRDAKGAPADPLCATDEHLDRRGDGGGNGPGNRRLACLECNSGRGSVDWLTYKSYKMGELTCV